MVVAATLPVGAAELPPGPLAAKLGERHLQLVLISEEDQREGPPLLGSYLVSDGRIEFRPRFPLAAGKRYRAKLFAGMESTTSEYRVPERESKPGTEVTAVFPTADALPANLLKFYLYFSAPMREGKEIFERVHLLDEQGRELEAPWRRQELWTDDARRLTLFIHPGRIKQGVNLREELGPVFQPSRTYTLLVDAGVLDAAGGPLTKPYRKTFRTLPEDHTRPLPSQWKLTPPPAGTRVPLTVEFPAPLDYALVARYLKVHDSAGRMLEGSGHLGQEERRWQFTPAAPWQAETYTLRADEFLEDLAGNTPVRVFDTDLSQPAPAPPDLSIPFQPQTESGSP